MRLDLQVVSYDEEGYPANSFLNDKTINGAEPNYFQGLYPVGNQLILFKTGYDIPTKTSILKHILCVEMVKKVNQQNLLL